MIRLIYSLRTGLPNPILTLVIVCSLGFGQIISAHPGGVNANGCHTPGGAGSGNPCHCHAEGDRTEELECENGAPVQEGSENEDGATDEGSDDDENASSETWLGLRVEDELECDGEGQSYVRDHYAYDSDADITIAHKWVAFTVRTKTNASTVTEM